jgi:hemerythrin
MALITWNDSYSVKVKQMDDQHRKLVDIINHLHDAMKAGKGKEAVDKVLTDLIAYTKTHFTSEETLMKLHAYPGYDDQKKAHTALVTQVTDIQKKFEAGSAPLSQDVMTFLKDWLIKHIQGADQKYGPYFNQKGVK